MRCAGVASATIIIRNNNVRTKDQTNPVKQQGQQQPGDLKSLVNRLRAARSLLQISSDRVVDRTAGTN